MGIDRDYFGRLRYSIRNKRKCNFSVTNTRSPYDIIKDDFDRDVSAVLVLDRRQSIYKDTPRFDSFIHAVRYLKENLEDLL